MADAKSKSAAPVPASSGPAVSSYASHWRVTATVAALTKAPIGRVLPPELLRIIGVLALPAAGSVDTVSGFNLDLDGELCGICMSGPTVFVAANETVVAIELDTSTSLPSLSPLRPPPRTLSPHHSTAAHAVCPFR
jgi:hypothetical protein